MNAVSGRAARSRSARPGTASGTNFSLFSEHAERRRAVPVRRRRRRDARSRSTRADRPQLALLPARASGPGQRYGYRVHGPYDPARGPALQPGKLLLDPYAKAIDGAVDWERGATCCPTCPTGDDGRRPRARRRGRRRGDAEVRRRSTSASTGRATARRAPVDRDGHLRDPRQGLHEAPPGRARGPARHLRRARLARPAIAYLRELGVTAVELLPVHHIADESFLVERGLTQLLGLQLDRLLRAARAPTPRPARAASRCASSRGWSRRCTAPASR